MDCLKYLNQADFGRIGVFFENEICVAQIDSVAEVEIDLFAIKQRPPVVEYGVCSREHTQLVSESVGGGAAGFDGDRAARH